MSRRLALLVPLALSLPALAGTKEDVAELREALQALQASHETLRADHDALEARLRRLAPTPEDQFLARELLTGAYASVAEGRPEAAKTVLVELMTAFPNTEAGRRAEDLAVELEVVGREVELQVESWIQGRQDSLAEGTTLVMFWEVWCPHCRREMPELQGRLGELRDQGVEVLGLTRMSRDSTLEEVEGFLAESGVTFPIGRSAEGVAEAFGVSGIPAAALVREGKIVWRGHPATLAPEVVAAYLGAASE